MLDNLQQGKRDRRTSPPPPSQIPLYANQHPISARALAHSKRNAKGFTPSASTGESYPKRKRLAQLQLPPTSLKGKWHFAGAELRVMFPQTGLQSRWGFLMCLITESVQVGKRDFSASLPSSPADNKLSKAISQSPADQESWLSDQDTSQTATWSYPL